MQSLKESLKGQYSEWSKAAGRNLTREEFVKQSGVSRHQIDRLFGNFCRFKADIAFKASRSLDSYSPVETKSEDFSCKAEFKVSGETATAELKAYQVKSLEDLLKECKVDLNKWHVKSYVVNKWDVARKNKASNITFAHGVATGTTNDDGGMTVQPLYQVKATLERKNAENNLKGIIEKWSPPSLAYTIPTYNDFLFSQSSDLVYVPVLSDLHFGAAASKSYTFNKESWGTKDTVKCVEKFTESVIKDAANSGPYKKAVIICLGDILHSLNGKTNKGTELRHDCIREEQFQYALDSLTVFISRMIEFFGKVEFKGVKGNHAGELESALYKALECYFRTDSRVIFENFSARTGSFKINNSLFLVDHGNDANYEGAKIPSGAKRETYVQSLFLNDPKNDNSVRSRYMCVGDMHHWENIEFDDFEFYMFGTTLLNDEYASAHNWRNRARQSSLVVDEDGVNKVIHTFFK